MIEIDISGQKYSASETNEGFLNEQIRRRQKDGLSVCIHIHINQNDIDLSLSCVDCGGGGGGGRRSASAEQEIFDLWGKFGCRGNEINPGKLIAFLNQIK